MREDDLNKDPSASLESAFEINGTDCALDVSSVSQSNALLNAQRSMSLAAKRVFLLILARVNPLNVEETNVFTVTAADYARLSNTCADSSYRNIKSGANELLRTVISAYDAESDETTSSCFLRRIIQPGQVDQDFKNEGWMRVQINDEYMQHIYDLSRAGYTRFALKHVMKFRSMHSIRLFELVSIFKETSKKTYISIDGLKKFMGIKPSSYPTFSSFKRKVLIPALSEINDHSDYNVDLSVTRGGLKVSRLVFSLALDADRELTNDELVTENKYVTKASKKKTQAVKKRKFIDALNDADVRAELEANGQQRID